MIGVVLGMLPVLVLPDLPPAGLSLLPIALGLGLLWGSAWWCRLCSGLAIGFALALVHGHALLDRRISAQCVGQPLMVSGVVASLPRSSDFPDGGRRQRFEFTVEHLEPPQCTGPQRILLSYYGTAALSPGDSWIFPTKLSKPWGLANPGSYNLQSWYAQTGIDAVGHVSGGPGAQQGQPPGAASFPNRVRQRIAERIHALPLPQSVRAVLAAITVADKSGINASLWSLFQTFGVNHLLVISGLHVGLVGAAALLLGKFVERLLLLAGIPAMWLPALLALACCSAYTALAGFSVATQRALLMLSCFLIAGLAGRNTGSANNLLLAAVVVLAINPLAALGSGFWLSFAAVAALLWLAVWQRGMGFAGRTLSTHVFMSLVMLPLGAWWFGGSSLVAALANLVMVPLVGLWVVPLALLAVLAMFFLPPAEMALWQLAAWPLQQLLPPAEALAGSAGDWFYHRLSPAWPDIVLAVVGVSMLAVRSSWWGRGLALLLALPLLLPLHRIAVGYPVQGRGSIASLQVTVLDVGQGTAVVVHSGDQTLVYDTGGGDPAGANMASAVVLPYLRHMGITAVDTLVISHPDNDHSAGAATLLADMHTKAVFYGGDGAALAGGKPCNAGQAWRWPGGLTFQFMAPVETSRGSSNDSSCVLLIEAAGHRLLLAGDVESQQEREMVRYWRDGLDAHWLLVAHHGSRTSSSHALLKTVRPGIAVISSGYANRFGHPHPDVVERLLGAGATVYDTARGGALEFIFAPDVPIQVRQRRQQVRRFWM
jgi:competence protein ComEC